MMRQIPAHAADLRQQFPQSRTQLAKLYELGEVTQGGQVSAARVLDLKRAGKPLSGAAAEVANAADVAPESMGVPGGAPAGRVSGASARGTVFHTALDLAKRGRT